MASDECIYAYGFFGSLWSTTDGIAWTHIPLPFPHDLESMEATPMACLVTRRDREVWISFDDVNWSQVEAPHTVDGRAYQSQIRMGNGVLVRAISAGAFSGRSGYPESGLREYSTTGREWTPVSIEGGVKGALEFGLDRFLLRNHNGIWRSFDGKTWERVSDLVSDGASLVSGNGVFVMNDLNQASGFRTWVSADGASWTAVNRTKPSESIIALGFFDGWFYARSGLDPGASILRSADGINWQVMDPPTAFDPFKTA
ncbi:MAG: hypothetical protein J6386_17250 [Candidatus Synoicihabitans palmerolidicus]|nr:hypothetical protein [Candidatus Synoicihabitans palmerolidicus]